MKTYQIIIRPITGFGTPLKGDTLFGHICWQIYYDKSLVNIDLDTLLSNYTTNPFCIVSSAYPYKDNKVFLKRPSLPLHYIFKFSAEELVRRRKELKRLNYFTLDLPLPPLSQIKYTNLIAEITDEQVRCSIHRIFGKTAIAPFAPFSVSKKWFLTDLAIFVGVREDIPIDGIIKALERVGHYGFGKDATSGWGKFKILFYEEIDLCAGFRETCNAYYTLSPFVPENNQRYKEIYYEPFIRFGRHGDMLSISKNPFKAPVLMADEGAVCFPEKFNPQTYIGKPVYNVSAVEPKTVVQGYTLVVPVEVDYEKQ